MTEPTPELAWWLLQLPSAVKVRTSDLGETISGDPDERMLRNLGTVKTQGVQEGTSWHRAPGSLLGSVDYTSAADLWALGCVAAELYVKHLFRTQRDRNVLRRAFQLLRKPTQGFLIELPQFYQSRVRTLEE